MPIQRNVVRLDKATLSIQWTVDLNILPSTGAQDPQLNANCISRTNMVTGGGHVYLHIASSGWDPQHTYNTIGTIVSWNGGDYTNRIAGQTNHQPDVSPTQWTFGGSSSTARLWYDIQAAVAPAWSATAAYNIGDTASYNGVNWKSLLNANLGNEPDTSPTAWKLAVTGPWSNTISYNQGDVVTYGNTMWTSRVASNLGNTPSSSPSQWASTVTKHGDTTGINVKGSDDPQVLSLFNALPCEDIILLNTGVLIWANDQQRIQQMT